MTSDRPRGGKPDGTGFAGRWSRLKRQAEAEPEGLEADIAEAGAGAAPAEVEAPEDDPRPDEEIIEELGLPDPETLKTGDDFSAFMAKAVPARIRNRALRKLWISNPVLANLDELLDYGEDFSDAATVVENLQTAYQVGKGFVERVAGLPEEDAGSPAAGSAEERAEEKIEKGVDEPSREPAEASDESAADAEDAGETPDLSGPESGAESGPESGAASGPVSTDEWVAAEENIPVRQRMRFRMAED